MSSVKKLVIFFSALTALIALSLTPASAVLVGTITASSLNIRSQPSTDSAIIDTVSYGVVMDVKSYGNTWVTVYYGDKIGYVSADYCSVKDVPQGSVVQPWENKTSNEAARVPGEITGSVVNFRTGASTDADVIGKLYRGAIVNILAPGDSWYKIESGGNYGYVSADYIRVYDGTSRGESTSGSGQAIVDYAERFLGTPYVYGGSSPSGFDCSGLVKYVAGKCGYDLSRTATSQYNELPHVSKSNLIAGDLVFFTGGGSKITHVGIYAGDGRMIHAPSPGKSVRYEKMSSGYYTRNYYGAARFAD